MAALLLVIACAEPELPEGAPPEGEPEPLTAEVDDPAQQELVEAIATLDATIEDARQHLLAAVDAQDATSADAAAAAALDRLLAEPDATQRGLFPARTTERGESDDSGDVLTPTLAVARELGGELGRSVVELLRDPIAGDLGAWERDAEGVVDRVRDATAGVGSVDAAIEDVAALDGEATRALAWVLLAVDSDDADLTRAAAERAEAHLGVVALAIEHLDGDADEPGDDATDGELTTDAEQDGEDP